MYLNKENISVKLFHLPLQCSSMWCWGNTSFFLVCQWQPMHSITIQCYY